MTKAIRQIYDDNEQTITETKNHPGIPRAYTTFKDHPSPLIAPLSS